MANYTHYIDYTTGLTLYSKGRPLDTGTWSNDVVAYLENGSTGEYSATLDDGTEYSIFNQAGGAPASSDVKIGYVDLNESADITAILADTNELQTDWADGGRLDLLLDSAGSATVSITPVVGIAQKTLSGTTITVFNDETKTLSISVVDEDGSAVDVSATTIEFVVEDATTQTDLAVVADGSMTKVTSAVSFSLPAALTATTGEYKWALRVVSTQEVLMHGPFVVSYAAANDS